LTLIVSAENVREDSPGQTNITSITSDRLCEEIAVAQIRLHADRGLIVLRLGAD
jgi:hypothetical protein